jgi:hypothetical protein
MRFATTLLLYSRFVIVACIVLAAAAHSRGAHPQILVSPADRDAIKTKLESTDWARKGYAAMRARIDPRIERTQSDPAFMSSRLMINWETRYTTPLVEKSRWVGGEGKAPVPTPRFAGARRVFAVDAPNNKAIRGALPNETGDAPTPTLLVRQQGEAWRRPFVTVFEPSLGSDGATIRSVRAAKVEGDDPSAVACVVEGNAFTAYLLQSEYPGGQYVVEGHTLQGGFSVKIIRDGAAPEIYPPSPPIKVSADSSYDMAELTSTIQGWIDKGYYPGASLLGALPWIDRSRNIYGIFLAHVDVRAAAKDKVNAFHSSRSSRTLLPRRPPRSRSRFVERLRMLANGFGRYKVHANSGDFRAFDVWEMPGHTRELTGLIPASPFSKIASRSWGDANPTRALSSVRPWERLKR